MAPSLLSPDWTDRGVWVWWEKLTFMGADELRESFVHEVSALSQADTDTHAQGWQGVVSVEMADGEADTHIMSRVTQGPSIVVSNDGDFLCSPGLRVVRPEDLIAAGLKGLGDGACTGDPDPMCGRDVPVYSAAYTEAALGASPGHLPLVSWVCGNDYSTAHMPVISAFLERCAPRHLAELYARQGTPYGARLRAVSGWLANNPTFYRSKEAKGYLRKHPALLDALRQTYTSLGYKTPTWLMTMPKCRGGAGAVVPVHVYPSPHAPCVHMDLIGACPADTESGQGAGRKPLVLPTNDTVLEAQLVSLTRHTMDRGLNHLIPMLLHLKHTGFETTFIATPSYTPPTLGVAAPSRTLLVSQDTEGGSGTGVGSVALWRPIPDAQAIASRLTGVVAVPCQSIVWGSLDLSTNTALTGDRFGMVGVPLPTAPFTLNTSGTGGLFSSVPGMESSDRYTFPSSGDKSTPAYEWVCGRALSVTWLSLLLSPFGVDRDAITACLPPPPSPLADGSPPPLCALRHHLDVCAMIGGVLALAHFCSACAMPLSAAEHGMLARMVYLVQTEGEGEGETGVDAALYGEGESDWHWGRTTPLPPLEPLYQQPLRGPGSAVLFGYLMCACRHALISALLVGMAAPRMRVIADGRLYLAAAAWAEGKGRTGSVSESGHPQDGVYTPLFGALPTPSDSAVSVFLDVGTASVLATQERERERERERGRVSHGQRIPYNQQPNRNTSGRETARSVYPPGSRPRERQRGQVQQRERPPHLPPGAGPPAKRHRQPPGSGYGKGEWGR
ncbi:hypothetical protein KIPB_002689 [Kipferlia bialata]|uniref:Uncharacterized protein n=1 Tax=Kipferlia bialata TaxID=797122 RepID=A0A9K3GGG1_9EUKA|nr:hypothetical protein KIPB_002689 [Kipferlia bialata]|eukprot:g2689.t1